MPRPPHISIELDNVSKRLGATQALREVRARFGGEYLHGLIGPDGAGKTTLLRLLVGFLHPDDGRLAYRQGRRPLPFEDVRPAIAYLPQQQSLYPDLSCREHLDFFRDLYRLPAALYAERSARLLRIARLERFEQRKAGELSGGMYKKLGVICALLHSPRAVLLDEPTNGVDPVSRRELWELIYGLEAQRILVLVSTSYMDEAERCSRVHLMEGGRVLLSGRPQELLRRERAHSFEELFLRRAVKG